MNITNQSLQTFLDYLQNIRRSSTHTIKSYERDLKQAQNFFSKQGLKNWNDINAADLRNFLRWQMEQGLSPKTVHRKLSALKSFYRHFIKMGKLKHNPALKIRGPKRPHSLPKPLEPDQSLISLP
jgi:integrase/recombinase XerC